MSASEQPVSTLLLVCFCFVMQNIFTDENFVQFIPALTKILITGLWHLWKWIYLLWLFVKKKLFTPKKAHYYCWSIVVQSIISNKFPDLMLLLFLQEMSLKWLNSFHSLILVTVWHKAPNGLCTTELLIKSLDDTNFPITLYYQQCGQSLDLFCNEPGFLKICWQFVLKKRTTHKWWQLCHASTNFYKVLTELSFTHIVTFIQNKPQTIPDKWKKVKIQSHIFSSNFQGLTLIPPPNATHTECKQMQKEHETLEDISFEHQKISLCWCSAFVLILHKLCYAWPWGSTKCHFAFASHLTHPCVAWHEYINWDRHT